MITILKIWIRNLAIIGGFLLFIITGIILAVAGEIFLISVFLMVYGLTGEESEKRDDELRQARYDRVFKDYKNKE